jgi:hypothetical protein
MSTERDADRNIWQVIDDRLDCLELHGQTGNAHAMTAMRKLAEFRELVHQFSDGETFGWAMLDIIDPFTR